jgi:hypothetical protein
MKRPFWMDWCETKTQEKEDQMKKALLLIPLVAMLSVSGCESRGGSAAAGGVAGAAIGAGAYEYRGREEMNRVEEMFKEGKIDQREYEIRRDQIQRDFLLQRD